ncbi:MAG: hypothetical protein ACRD1L_14975, partial [Terriglobales bacterium]
MDRWSTPPLPDCLPQAAWEDLVAGLYTPSHAAAALQHAISCPTCGRLLRRAAEEAAAGSAIPDAELQR